MSAPVNFNFLTPLVEASLNELNNNLPVTPEKTDAIGQRELSSAEGHQSKERKPKAPKWTSLERQNLKTAIQKQGSTSTINWEAVAQEVGTREARKCKAFYSRHKKRKEELEKLIDYTDILLMNVKPSETKAVEVETEKKVN